MLPPVVNKRHARVTVSRERSCGNLVKSLETRIVSFDALPPPGLRVERRKRAWTARRKPQKPSDPPHYRFPRAAGYSTAPDGVTRCREACDQWLVPSVTPPPAAETNSLLELPLHQGARLLPACRKALTHRAGQRGASASSPRWSPRRRPVPCRTQVCARELSLRARDATPPTRGRAGHTRTVEGKGRRRGHEHQQAHLHMLPRPDGHRPPPNQWSHASRAVPQAVITGSRASPDRALSTNCFCVLNPMAWEAGAVERARELLQKALAAKDSKEALKICENFELQVSPARARVVVRFAVAR